MTWTSKNTYNKVMWTMRITSPGGTPVVKQDEEIIYGGIGVGGRAPGEPGLQDGDIELAGLNTLQDALQK